MKQDERRPLIKLCGGDFELGNFILGDGRPGETCFEASRALLREIDGLPLSSHHCEDCACSACEAPRTARETWGGSSAGYAVYRPNGGETGGASFNPQDWGRKFLPSNGGCCYIDLDHVEICLPECRSARDHTAAWHAMLGIVRRALVAANAKRECGRIRVLVANSDGLGHAWGGHLGFLVRRRTWDNLFLRKMHHLIFLAGFQASSVILTGQGKVGSENGRPGVEYQLSQRADFFETLTGPQTTFRRPMVNSRDEALCGPRQGPGADLARLHVIFFDNSLMQVASFLKVGMMQLVLAMIEAERVRPDLILDDPVAALHDWSHDPTLSATALTTSGRELNALEMQMLFLEEATRFVREGACDGAVPEAEEILGLWEETLVLLESGDLPALARRLDWALKLVVLHRAMEQNPGMGWSSPEIKHLDQVYGSLDAEEGLYWAYQRAGLVDRVVTRERVRNLEHEPPHDTRAWTRAALLRRAAPQTVEDVDWDRIRFRIPGPAGERRLSVELEDPRGFTRDATAGLLDGCGSLSEVLEMLGAREETSYRAKPRGYASH